MGSRRPRRKAEPSGARATVIRLAVPVLRGLQCRSTPGRDWLAAGITGLQRQREWDAVATSEGRGNRRERRSHSSRSPTGRSSWRRPATASSRTSLAAALARRRRAAVPRARGPAAEISGPSARVRSRSSGLDPDPAADRARARPGTDRPSLLVATGCPPIRRGRRRSSGIAAAASQGAYAAHAHRLRGDLWELSSSRCDAPGPGGQGPVLQPVPLSPDAERLLRKLRAVPARRRGPAPQAPCASRPRTSARSSPSSSPSPTTSWRQDRRVQAAARERRVARGTDLRGLRGRPRGVQADDRRASLRRPAHGRDRPPRGRYRRDEDGRGKDLRRRPARST